jgi:signal transduction histidine kinase
MQHYLLGLFIVGNIIVALMVYLNNPKNWTNTLFTTLTLVITAYLGINTELYLLPNFETKLFFSKMIMALGALINVFVLLFLTTFPKEKIPLKPWQTIVAIVSTAIMFFLALSGGIIQTITVTPENLVIPTNGWAMPLFGLHTLIMILAGLVSIFRGYKKSQGVERSRFGYVFLGFLALFSLIIIFNFVLPTVFKIGFFVPFLPIYILLFNGIIAYAIIRHRLLDIRIIVARAISFTLLTAVLSFIYASILFRLPSVLPTPYQIPAYVILAIVLAYTFNPLKLVIEKLSNNVFYRQPYDSGILLERLGELLRSTLSLHTLLRGVASELQVTIQASSAWFVIISEKTEECEKIGYGKELPITPNTVFNLKKICHNASLIMFEELEEGVERDFLRQLGIAVLIPLRVKEKLHGFLLMGEKSSGNIFSNQDSNVLDILAPQISIATQNALSYEEISRFNITLKEEIEKATTDLKNANKNLKHLDKIKDEFVFIATHELKNPVTAMRGYLSMFQEGSFGEIPAQMKDPMNQLQASNQQLVELVNDLLQIARSEAKTLTVHTEPINLCPIIDIVKESLKPLSDQKKLSVIHSCPNGIPQVQADTQRVKEIVNNLLSNAIKYSDSGTITVSHEINVDKVITHVTDQGVGISIEDQHKLFTRFFRAEEEAAKGIPGTGLGLFIVKQLIEKMGGTIWLITEKGKGSTFSFSLPTV